MRLGCLACETSAEVSDGSDGFIGGVLRCLHDPVDVLLERVVLRVGAV